MYEQAGFRDYLEYEQVLEKRQAAIQAVEKVTDTAGKADLTARIEKRTEEIGSHMWMR